MAMDAAGLPQGFMFLHDGHLEALFIKPGQHGRGMGKGAIAASVPRHNK